MSTAFMTWALDVTVEPYDVDGTTLTGDVYHIQVTSISPSLKQGVPSITNSLSPVGLAEFVMGVSTSGFRLSGIVDGPNDADLIGDSAFFQMFSAALNHRYVQLTTYFAKVEGSVTDPLRIVQKAVIEEITPTGKTSDEGAAWTFEASGKGTGAVALEGTQASPALVSGASS